jgi:hypothetical protein
VRSETLARPKSPTPFNIEQYALCPSLKCRPGRRDGDIDQTPGRTGWTVSALSPFFSFPPKQTWGYS